MDQRSIWLNRPVKFLASALVLLFVSGCGGGGGGDSQGQPTVSHPISSVIAFGTIGAAGGTIADASGETAVIVPAGIAPENTLVQIHRGTNAAGEITFRISTSNPLSGEVQIVLPDPDLLNASLPAPDSPAQPSVLQGLHIIDTDRLNTTCRSNPPTLGNPDNAYPSLCWKTNLTWSYFWDTNAIGVGNRIDNLSVAQTIENDGDNIVQRIASALYSVCAPTDDACLRGTNDSYEPVLFVHGFLAHGGADNDLSNFGGGKALGEISPSSLMTKL